MLSKWRWKLLQITRRLWVRATLIGAAGVVTALLAAIGERFIPWQLPGNIGAEAVDDILKIIASSMLAVTTFSLSVMTSAFNAAASGVTPRATKLLQQDRVTQNVLATFIGSFLFALVGIVMLKTGIYGERGRVVLFFATIAVIALIVFTLLRWIDHLSRLGRLGETANRIEKVTEEAIDSRLGTPSLGGHAFDLAQGPPSGATAVISKKTGYIQHIDITGLSERAEALDATFYIGALPGTFVDPARPLLWVQTAQKIPEEDIDEACDKIRRCFDVGIERTFDQDPRFGIAVMSEIATGALAPGVSDSGTAIDVIGRLTRLLVRWGETTDAAEESNEIAHPRLHVPPIDTRDLFDDAFNLIARDGAGLIEVQIRLQKALHALSNVGNEAFRACAKTQARLAFERALQTMTADQDKARLRETVESGR